MALLTERAGAIADGAVRAKGWDPATYTLTGNDRDTLTQAANDALREAWSRQKWPLLMRTEQRQYRPDYSLTETYFTGNEAWDPDTEAYWRSLADDNLGNAPAEGSAYWEQPSDFIPFIQYAQPWETFEIWEQGVDLNAFAWLTDPRLSPGLAPIGGCDVWMDSIVLPQSVPNKIWVRFMPRCPELSFVEWDEATVYAAGEACFRTLTGRSYTASAESAAGYKPEEHPELWTEVGVPKFMSRFVRLYMLAEWRTADEGKYQTLSESRAELEVMEQGMFERAGVAQGARVAGFRRVR